MPLLVTADGSTPLPPSDVTRGVRRVDPSLELKWLPAMTVWAVIAPWRASDPRNGLVQTGELAPGSAFDVICTLPADCPVDAAESYLRRGLVSSSREDVVKMLDRIEQFNDARSDDLLDQAAAPVLDDIDSIAGRRLTNTASSFVNDATQKTRKRKR
jgi:hypothetical protein